MLQFADIFMVALVSPSRLFRNVKKLPDELFCRMNDFLLVSCAIRPVLI